MPCRRLSDTVRISQSIKAAIAQKSPLPFELKVLEALLAGGQGTRGLEPGAAFAAALGCCARAGLGWAAFGRDRCCGCAGMRQGLLLWPA